MPAEDPPLRPPAKHFRMLDFDTGRVEVLGLLTLHLTGPYSWHTGDYEEGSSFGATFVAIDPESHFELGCILVADVTADPSEPWIGPLSQAGVTDLDLLFRAEAAKGGLGPLLRWMGSHLNVTAEAKALVTAYVVEDAGRERQVFVARMQHHERKLVLFGAFFVDVADRVAGLIHGTLRNAVMMPRVH